MIKNIYHEKRSKIPNLREVNCCINCKFGEMDYEDAWCKKYKVEMSHYEICDDYEEE